MNDNTYKRIKKALKDMRIYNKKLFKENYRHWRKHGKLTPVVQHVYCHWLKHGKIPPAYQILFGEKSSKMDVGKIE